MRNCFSLWMKKSLFLLVQRSPKCQSVWSPKSHNICPFGPRAGILEHIWRIPGKVRPQPCLSNKRCRVSHWQISGSCRGLVQPSSVDSILFGYHSGSTRCHFPGGPQAAIESQVPQLGICFLALLPDSWATLPERACQMASRFGFSQIYTALHPLPGKRFADFSNNTTFSGKLTKHISFVMFSMWTIWSCLKKNPQN